MMNLVGVVFVFLCLNGVTLAQHNNWPHRSAVASASVSISPSKKSPAPPASSPPTKTPPMNSPTYSPRMTTSHVTVTRKKSFRYRKVVPVSSSMETPMDSPKMSPTTPDYPEISPPMDSPTKSPAKSVYPALSPPMDSPTKSPAKSVYPALSPPMDSPTKSPAKSIYPKFSPSMDSPTKSPAKSVYPFRSSSMMQSVSPSPSRRAIRFAITCTTEISTFVKTMGRSSSVQISCASTNTVTRNHSCTYGRHRRSYVPTRHRLCYFYTPSSSMCCQLCARIAECRSWSRASSTGVCYMSRISSRVITGKGY
eukprot:g408.t1